MNQYAKAAIKAIELCRKNHQPLEAWKKAIAALTTSTESREKSCLKEAFLGLCEESLVKDIDKGNYCSSKSIKNKQYAIDAVKLLKKDPSLSKNKNLLIEKTGCNNNQQMDVVLALWNAGLIV